MSIIGTLRELDDDSEKLAFARSAIKEFIKRLEGGDIESALSISKACLVGLDHGSNSAEFRAHILLEEARLKSTKSGGLDA